MPNRSKSNNGSNVKDGRRKNNRQMKSGKDSSKGKSGPSKRSQRSSQ